MFKNLRAGILLQEFKLSELQGKYFGKLRRGLNRNSAYNRKFQHTSQVCQYPFALRRKDF